MKKYLIGIAAAAAVVIAGSAFAAANMQSSYLKAGPVVGIEAGWSQQDLYFKSADEYYGSIGGGVYVGYNFESPNFNHWLFGAQLGYKWLGYQDESRGKIYSQAVDVLFGAKYYVYEGVNMFAKAGFATLIQTYDDLVTPLMNGGIKNETYFRLRPEYQIGIGYAFNQNMDLYLAYNHIGADGVDVETYAPYAVPRTNALLVGFSYTF